MPTSLHVLLIHGYQVIQNFSLPMGMLSEEAQESNNKMLKKIENILHGKLLGKSKLVYNIVGLNSTDSYVLFCLKSIFALRVRL